MKDYIIRATAANDQIRVFAATTRELVEAARKAHGTSPVATAALGRLLTAGAMMGSMMKGENDLLTLQVKGDGPLGGMTVTADSTARVKGYVGHPEVLLPPSPAGKLDVGGAVGQGDLVVIKDLGLKEPYVGRTALVSGEIAEDITSYFAVSEQIPSAVALGVLMSRENEVEQAGGFLLQLMPFAEEETISALETKLAELSSITSMLNRGMTPEDILQELLGDLGVTIHEQIETEFFCNCDKKRVEKALISIGKKEIEEMIAEEKPIEVNCHFCGKQYPFDVEELKSLLKQACR
ncbi:MAG: Hsp33 family molecular chaperone HslO [Lachnospiraceae bacterium]|jgi:molecular chaperone Hsp33|nr:Hsp33 family molecular chaperone HslO [Lachnospiraceae bacterium]